MAPVLSHYECHWCHLTIDYNDVTVLKFYTCWRCLRILPGPAVWGYGGHDVHIPAIPPDLEE